MEILKFTEEHKEYRQRLKDFFAKEVLPNVDQWEKDHIVPKSMWNKIGKAGFLCAGVPEEYGGWGGDFLHSVIASEEIVQTNHYGLIIFLHSEVCAPYISAFASEELKKKYLPGCVSGDIVLGVAMTEPNAGSDLAALVTTAVEEGDRIVLNGAKIFTSNGVNGDLFIVAAKDPEIENPYQAVSLYLVEPTTPGFKIGQRLDKMGFRSQDTVELFFTDCKIPKENLIGEKGKGFYYLMNKLQQERLICSLAGLAQAEFILDETIKHYKKLKDNGLLSEVRQSKQHTIVDMAAEVKVTKTFLYTLINDHMEGKDIVTETSMAKFWASEMVRRVADASFEIFGLEGTLEKNRIERAWRDCRGISIFAGTNQIMREIIAKRMGL